MCVSSTNYDAAFAASCAHADTSCTYTKCAGKLARAMRGISYPMLFYGSLIKKYSTFSPVYTMKHESYMIITIIDIQQTPVK
jgi:hypothetical protein